MAQTYTADEVKVFVDLAVAGAIETAAQVLYDHAERANNDEIERTYCGAAEYVRRTIDPEFN